MTGSRVQSVAVLGGGISGSVAAVALARQGTAVDLIEIATDWRGVGHGITLQGNALRALEKIGVADEVIAHGYPFNHLRLLKADGELLIDLETARTGGDHLPSTVGSLRSSLQQILCDAVYASGVKVRLGLSVTAIDQDDDGAHVTFSDGTKGDYDLVIGADGIRSRTRAMIGIDTVPQQSGMSIWRISAPRPAALTCAEVYYGGPHYKAGYSPIAEDHCYAYMLDEMLDRESFGDRPPAAILRERSAGYGGIWGQIRDGLRDDTPVNYQWIEWLLIDGPWHRGRVVLIGDAAHACPPLIAQGAAMCLEDAVVLAEILGQEPDLEVALGRFVDRRLPRVRRVVDASLQLVGWEIHPDQPGADPAGVMTRTLASLVEPA